MPVATKICGLSTPEDVQAAVEGGAAYVGFVFFTKSPRNLAPAQAAELARPARAAGVKAVAVTVEASDAELDAIMATLAPELIQLHGNETPARVAGVRARTGVGVIRALRVSEPADLEAARAFEDVADQLMFDAKPSADAILPGGNGAGFDASILAGWTFACPWFLAGGLEAGNVAAAVAASGASRVDVSSGVERAPGVKDPALIRAFLEAVRRA
ncbi:phosphoribosylanthranilate isomerase [Caulobacter sp. S45]|uniref:phosphoribosylanthranilate isomerase n=1 Tax=Caulobacter sp. S45 TaxID=1641861 RepID=UPI001576C27B|nr:phosphoribosylanthranilate isomerase [Caulobacter sp. S45]